MFSVRVEKICDFWFWPSTVKKLYVILYYVMPQLIYLDPSSIWTLNAAVSFHNSLNNYLNKENLRYFKS